MRENYFSEYYQKNKDKIREKRRKYRLGKGHLKVKRQRKKYWKKNRKELIKKSTAYAKRNPDKAMKYNLKKYNIGIDEYNKLFQRQGGRCAICEKHQSEINYRLSVDHNHLTGEIRGLLCKECNWAIGQLGADNGVELLKRAVSYLGVQ